MTGQETVSPTVDADLRQRAVDRIAALLPKVLKRDAPGVSEATRLVDFELSSASMLELMLELEDDLDIQVDVEEFDESDAETVGSLATYIAAHAQTFD